MPPNSRSPRNTAAGGGEIDPLSQFVCDRVKRLRKARGWTLEQLSAQSNVSRSMLSQVERGQANPTLGVAFRIAQAFGVSLAELVEGAVSQPLIEVVRHEDRSAIFRDDQVCCIRTLSPMTAHKDVEFYEVTLQPGQCLTSAAHFDGTRELITVRRGRVRVGSGDQEVLLRKGDSAQYTADVEHWIRNESTRPSEVVMVEVYPEAARR